MKNKLVYLALFGLFTYFAVQFLKTERLNYVAMTEGIVVEAEVYGRPKCGSARGRVEVLVDKRVLVAFIPKNPCLEGLYRVGDKIEVYYSKEYDAAVQTDYPVTVRYWTSILFYVVPLYFLYHLLRVNK